MIPGVFSVIPPNFMNKISLGCRSHHIMGFWEFLTVPSLIIHILLNIALFTAVSSADGRVVAELEVVAAVVLFPRLLLFLSLLLLLSLPLLVLLPAS